MYGRLLKHLWDLQRTRRLDPDAITRWQLGKFRHLFEHAREHSRYYRQFYREAGVLDLRIRDLSDLQKIPFTDKAGLRSGPLEDHLTCPIAGPAFSVHSTSGSTGEPYRIWTRKTEDFTSHIRVLSTLLREGYRPHKKITMIHRLESDARLEVETDLSLLSFLQERLGLFRREIISVFEDPDEVLKRLQAEQPYILWSTVSITDILARAAERKGLQLQLPVLVLMSETMTAAQRDRFKRHLAGRIVHVYGMMESPCIAASFDTPDHMEVLAASVLVEFCEAPKEMGSDVAEVVITNLVNHTQPFIRYRTGDLIRVSERDPDFPTKRIPRVLGRVDDILTLVTGRALAHHHAHDMFMGFHYCDQWKFIQRRDGSLVLQLKVSANAERKAVEKKARAIWRKRYPEEALQVEFVDHMPLDPNIGKFKNIERYAGETPSLPGSHEGYGQIQQ